MVPKGEYIGCPVRVIGRGHYKDKAIGRTGVVASFWSDESIGVRLDGAENASSKYGYFYFKLTELQFIGPADGPANNYKGENETMKIENYFNIAMVQFLNDSRSPAPLYEYANYDPGLQVGDRCVVMSAHHGLGLAEVVDFKETPDQPVLREIVAKFDTTEYDARVAKREKEAELRGKMQVRAKKLQDMALFQALAQNDSEMAQMVQEYLVLMNS